MRMLGLDLGLSGARAAVIDETGRVLGAGTAACTHRHAGDTEHDPRAWLDEVDAATREAVRAADVDFVDAISVGALGPAPVLLDARLDPLLAAPLFSLDARAEPYRRDLTRELEHVIGPDHVLPRLRAWSETEPSAIDAAAWVVDATGYVVSSLVGRPVMDRITLADYVTSDAPLPVPIPTAEEPSGIAGELSPEAAERLTLRPGAPVTVGTYDTFVDVAALPADGGDVTLLLGSTLVMGTVADAHHVPEGLRSSPHVGEGSFVGGWTSTAGSAIDWSSSLAAPSEAASATRDAASIEPGAHGLVALPYLAGERAPVWDALARGVLVGVSLRTTPADVVRAILDGVALSALDLLGRLLPIVGNTPRVWVAGGGTRNDAWLAATADALGVPLDVADLAGGVAAARFALRAVGGPVPQLLTRRVDPDPARHRRYLELFAIYSRLYPALRDEMHALNQLELELAGASRFDREQA
jgi:xylulokinase